MVQLIGLLLELIDLFDVLLKSRILHFQIFIFILITDSKQRRGEDDGIYYLEQNFNLIKGRDIYIVI